MLTRRQAMIGAGAAALLPGLSGAAEAVAFDAAWMTQTFPRKRANAYTLNGDAVEVASDSAVSLLVRPVPESQWPSRAASWRWEVTQSVPPTDLARRGGDDRNLALYFVFLTGADADLLRGASVRRVLTNRAARILVYVWGGPEGAPRMQPSPWLDGRGHTVMLRPAGTGAHAESVDLGADHARAFGRPPEVLFGLGLSADSDDTETRIRARLSGLRLS